MQCHEMGTLVKRAAAIFTRRTSLFSWRHGNKPAVQCYRGQASTTAGACVVDLRSDVRTQPTAAMKQAMMNATFGDDVFGEDLTVNELQTKMAELFGKEAALFVPSGTMGNLIAVLAHCNSRGLEVLLGSKSHLTLYEQGGIATLGGVHPRSVPESAEGLFDLSTLDEYIRPKDDPHQPWTGLISVENTHNICGGSVMPLEYLAKLQEKATSYDIPVHMDGARVMNAVAALNVSPAEVLQYVDSASICFSKGVGAPIGSIIVGSEDLIARSLRLRKVLGGGWRQPGMLAAAALVAMDGVIPRLQRDHANAKTLAKAIMQHSNGVVNINLDGVHSNIVMIDIIKDGLTSVELCKRLEQVTNEEAADLGERVAVLAYPFPPNNIRLVLYSSVTDDHLKMATRKLQYVLREEGKVVV